MSVRQSYTEECLLLIIGELSTQHDVGNTFPPSLLSFTDWIDHLQEYTEHREWGIAYESLVATLEQYPFTLSGPASVKLLEIGLLFGFKTEREEDAGFDRRTRGSQPDA